MASQGAMLALCFNAACVVFELKDALHEMLVGTALERCGRWLGPVERDWEGGEDGGGAL